MHSHASDCEAVLAGIWAHRLFGKRCQQTGRDMKRQPDTPPEALRTAAALEQDANHCEDCGYHVADRTRAGTRLCRVCRALGELRVLLDYHRIPEWARMEVAVILQAVYSLVQALVAAAAAEDAEARRQRMGF